MTDNRTTELRGKLTERGVEYTANDGEYVKETCWPYMGELIAAFAEFDNGTTRFACDTWCFTPEQAIAATLGNSKSTADAIAELRKVVREAFSGESVSILVEGHAIMRAIDAVEAATLGSERDEIYDAGFDSGVKATLQQLEGVIAYGDGLADIEAWIDEQWKEYGS